MAEKIDSYCAATHNRGITNSINSVVLKSCEILIDKKKILDDEIWNLFLVLLILIKLCSK